MTDRIKVKSLPLGNTTDEGRYWAEVDGEKVGEDGRAFWETRQQAKDCGFRFLVKKLNFEG